MKKKLFALAALVAALGSTAGTASAQDVLTGDTRLACEAILCLSSGTRPSECTPSLSRYFNITKRKLSDTIRARLNFLQLCPVASQTPEMQSLVSAISRGAGRCDAQSLNSTLVMWTGGYDDGRKYISNQLPAGCYSFDLAAWRLRMHIRNDKGDLWTKAANYHSRTPQYNAIYRAYLIKRAGKWENWLVARFPTFDATQPGKLVVAAIADAGATPWAGQGATVPGTPASDVAVSAQPVQVVKASMSVRHYNRAAAAALAAVFAPASIVKKWAIEATKKTEPHK